MKVALIHDSLIEFGGAERVLQTILKIFPHADIYTSYASEEIIEKYFPSIPFEKIHVISLLQHSALRGHTTLLQTLSFIVWKSFDLANYDLVISSSSYALCNLVRVNPKKHVLYIHSPPKNLFQLAPVRPLQKVIPYTNILSKIYINAIKHSKNIITNSKFTHDNIYRLTGVRSKIIYPPVHIPKSPPLKHKISKYFIIVSRLDEIKNIDLAILACNEMKLPLKIIGKAANKKYLHYLHSIAGPTIQFLGEKTDKEISNLYHGAKAFIFTAENEDFGIAPVEAMAHGVPAIAFKSGGLRETIIPSKTGLFFTTLTIKALINSLKSFNEKQFQPHVIYSNSKKYSEEKFVNKLESYMKKKEGI